jgi:hypothetical protein
MAIRLVTALNAVVATTTSDPIDVKYAKKITLLLTQADHSSGNFVFTVSGSVDGTTFVALNNLRDNSTGVLTLVASKTLSTDTSVLMTVDLCGTGMSLSQIKVTGTRTTDGTATALVYIETDEEC